MYIIGRGGDRVKKKKKFAIERNERSENARKIEGLNDIFNTSPVINFQRTCNLHTARAAVLAKIYEKMTVKKCPAAIFFPSVRLTFQR